MWCPGGEPLHEMEFKSLARGRMCAKKVIAEPERQGPRDERPGGLRSNSIAFPQATAHVSGSNELPPPKDAAAAFMRETVIIALAGADVEDLHKAKWAEVRRTPYVDAAEFFTRHDQFYHGSVTVNHDRASTDLQESGSTSLRNHLSGYTDALPALCLFFVSRGDQTNTFRQLKTTRKEPKTIQTHRTCSCLTLLHGKRDHVYLLIQIRSRRVFYRTPCRFFGVWIWNPP